MGNNRYGFDTGLRYAVIAPLRGACSCGCFDAEGYAHELLSFILFTLHGRKRRRVSLWMARAHMAWF